MQKILYPIRTSLTLEGIREKEPHGTVKTPQVGESRFTSPGMRNPGSKAQK